MNKLFALLALALVIALPACRKDKDKDLKNRVKTTRYDDTGKKVYEKKEKGVAKKGNMRRNMDTMVDEEDLADGEHKRVKGSGNHKKHEHNKNHTGHGHHNNKNRATMLDCDDLESEDQSCDCDYDDQD